MIVAYAGLMPDLDGIGLIWDKLTGETALYFTYHHYLCHNLVAAIGFSVLAVLLARTQKFLVGCLTFLVVHLHIIGDLAGSKGADGYQWPIYYLYPFSQNGTAWAFQWELNAWQNHLLLLGMMCCCAVVITKRQISFLELFHKRLDLAAVEMFYRYILRRSSY